MNKPKQMKEENKGERGEGDSNGRNTCDWPDSSLYLSPLMGPVSHCWLQFGSSSSTPYK
jgi:hypothetical protein